MDEVTVFEPKLFEYNGKTFKYDFNILTIRQVELAREVAEFKANQRQAEPETFNAVVKSGGADWFTRMLCYILREVKNGVVQPFVKDTAEIDALNFVENLPAKERKTLMECVQDFFTNIEMPSYNLLLLPKDRKPEGMQMLLPILAKMMNTKTT